MNGASEKREAADDRRTRMRELKRIRTENALRLEIAQQEQQLRALAYAGFGSSVSHVPPTTHSRRIERASVLEDFADPDSLFVNAADYVGEIGYGYGPAQQSPWLSTRSDRQDGRNRPMFATETELAAIRGAARLLANYNPNAVGILEHLTNYTIGEGFDYKCLDRSGGHDALARRCQQIVDRFLDDNDFVGEVDAELFFRSRSDGEYFYGLWHQGQGRVEARIIEPEQVTEPARDDEISDWLEYDGADNWSFGVHTKADDTESIHGYYVQWSNNPQDWDYLPGGRCPWYCPPSGSACWVEHAKVNVSRKIKRGLSDFFCAQVMLEAARKLLRNMGTGASVQAAIAWIVETAPGTLPATVTSLAASQSTGTYGQQTQQGSRSLQTAKYDPGTVLYTPNGTQYKSAPMGSANAPNFVLVYEAMMRSLAVRWQMPEHMVTGSAANNDYASILEAGSPFEKAVRRKQQFYVRSHKRILWKVLEFACEAGVLGDVDFPTLRQAVHLVIRPPRVAVRDRLKEVQADQILVGMGAMSPATAAANDGLDYKEEVADGAGEEVLELSEPVKQ
jgi:hypothetical protein